MYSSNLKSQTLILLRNSVKFKAQSLTSTRTAYCLCGREYTVNELWRKQPKLNYLNNQRKNSSKIDNINRQKAIIETAPKIVIDNLNKARLQEVSTSEPEKGATAQENGVRELRNISWLWSKVDPYTKLMRLDKPIGYWLLFWPGSWSIALAGSQTGASPDVLAYNLALFFAGAVLMRSAGCTINDLWDRDIDAKVERTKSRPLVSGAITQDQAVTFLAAQLSGGLAILLQLNWYSILLGASSMGLVITYPLAKRFTNYPQVFLGCTFNWGALLGYSAVAGHCDWAVCMPVYGAACCWTVLYDTIYAHQDKLDDARIGIKSTAITFGENTKLALYAIGAAGGALLTSAGLVTDMGPAYYLGVSLAAAHGFRQIYTLNPDNPTDCANKFRSNSWIGLIIFLSIVLGGMQQYQERRRNINTNQTRPT